MTTANRTDNPTPGGTMTTNPTNPAATVAVALVDGAAVTVPAGSAHRFAGLDAYGNRVYRADWDADYLYALTLCCNATGKGSDSETGVVCRACYRTVDSYYGGPAELAVARADAEPAAG